MGNYFTRSKSDPLLPYMAGKVSSDCTLGSNINLVVKPTSLTSAFVRNRNLGLFTVNAISKDTLIMEVDMTTECKMNDGMIQLDDILRAQTSMAMYKAWKDVEESYYDIERAEEVINVRMVTNGSKNYYQAIKDIPAGGELLRIYGFTSLIFEIYADVLTNKNIVGFAHFLADLCDNVSHDPLRDRVYNFARLLPNLGIVDIYSRDLHLYDMDMKIAPTRYMFSR